MLGDGSILCSRIAKETPPRILSAFQAGKKTGLGYITTGRGPTAGRPGRTGEARTGAGPSPADPVCDPVWFLTYHDVS